MSRAFIALSCLSLLLACPENVTPDGGASGGGNGAGGGNATGGGPAPTVDTWCDTRAAANCERGVACGVYESVTGCEGVADRGEEFGSFCAASRAAVNDARASFDSAAAQSCLGSLSTCSPGSACGNVFTGLVTLDGGCYASEECDESSYCELGGRCPGRCRARKTEGSRANNSQECEVGLFAQLGATDGGGFGYSCVRQAAPGASCSGYQSCLDPLICEPFTNTCVPLLAADANCGTTDGGSVTYPVCAAPLTCQPNFDGGHPACSPLAQRGQPCGTCQADLRCVTPAGQEFGTCEALGDVDDDCAFDRDCAYPLFCKPTGTAPIGPGKCTARGAAGAVCTSDFSCSPGLSCVSRPRDGGIGTQQLCAAVDGGVTLGCRDTTP